MPTNSTQNRTGVALNKKNKTLCMVALGSSALFTLVPPARAQSSAGEPVSAARIAELRQRVEEQSQQLDALKRLLAAQEAKLGDMRRALADESLGGLRGGQATATPAATAAPTPAQVPTPVGQAPDDAGRRADLAPIFEQPGVLTPKGKYVLEPSLQYSYSSSNRVALVGYTIIPAILVGVIDIREVRRSTYTASLTGRMGVSNRFELEARVPYVYRSDTGVGREFLQGAATNSTIFDSTGHGVGDVEMTGRYQLNTGGADSPYFVGSLRVKSRTGKDPFEVETSRSVIGFRNDGVQTELPTGSGFWGAQPAVTVLFPSDPAVFFGTVSYLHSFSRSNVKRNTDQGVESLGKVAPGGIFGFNFGLGLGLNEKSSMSFGYDHASVGKTKVDGQNAPGSVRVQLGTLLFGYSYRLGPQRSLNVSLGTGVTRDTPDVTLTVRVPVTF